MILSVILRPHCIWCHFQLVRLPAGGRLVDSSPAFRYNLQVNWRIINDKGFFYSWVLRSSYLEVKYRRQGKLRQGFAFDKQGTFK